MTRVATPKNEGTLLNVAFHGTARHVEQQVRWYRQVKRQEALSEEKSRHPHRAVSWLVDEAGYWVFRGRLTGEQGAAVARGLRRRDGGCRFPGCTAVPRWHGEEMDPQMAVLELIQRE